jgi:hypothetical protein
VTEREGRQAETVGEARGGVEEVRERMGYSVEQMAGKGAETRGRAYAESGAKERERHGRRGGGGRGAGGRGAGGRGLAATASPRLAPSVHAESSLPHYSASS